MGDKSVQKKKYIVDTAKKVFIEKGFKRVTMKDIVEACDISRGGLYLYFDNTNEIFLEVLKADREEADDVFAGSLSEDATMPEILYLFLKEQKKEILRRKDNLTQAIYEFYFENKTSKKDNVLKTQFDSGVLVLQKLIDAGAANDEFFCENPAEAARNIMFVLEGMKISAQTIGVSADTIDAQIRYIMRSLGVSEN